MDDRRSQEPEFDRFDRVQDRLPLSILGRLILTHGQSARMPTFNPNDLATMAKPSVSSVTRMIVILATSR
jgi:hypothetical protein